jgi:hypothetical protein
LSRPAGRFGDRSVMSFTQVIVALVGQMGRQCANLIAMRSRTYRLEAEGELSDQLAHLFGGMTLTRDHGNTVFVGRVRDQGELFGVLQRFADLGLTLVSVDPVAHEAEH